MTRWAPRRTAGRADTGHVGDTTLRRGDYLYFAIAVQSTFGTTDVNVTTRDIRRTVMVHNCLAFVFNSVIIALIVSLTITVAT